MSFLSDVSLKFLPAAPLKLLVLPLGSHPLDEKDRRLVAATLEPLLSPGDEWEIAPSSGGLAAGAEARMEMFDAAIVWRPCGPSSAVKTICAAGLPAFALQPPLCFHPFHATFERQIEERGGVLLPAHDPPEIAASLRALRARQALKTARLIVVDAHENDEHAAVVQAFAASCRARMGVEIIRRPVTELLERAQSYDDASADRELRRWQDEVLDGRGEMDEAHMRQVARLYLGQRALLDENGACGITTEDIGAFLQAPQPHVMPNVAYGALACDGFLACEEGDVEVLASELLLWAATGRRATMSNIYLAYRDCFDALDDAQNYTPEMERLDYLQCLRDNHAVPAHFSASGVLPPHMMQEARYRVREALPAWPGQSMIVSTPRLGPVALARLSPDCSGLHRLRGEVDGLGLGDQYGWYRGRWFIRLPSVADFIERCLHPHYAIVPCADESDADGGDSGADDWRCLEILSERLLGLARL